MYSMFQAFISVVGTHERQHVKKPYLKYYTGKCLEIENWKVSGNSPV